jgi:hypothetical protein
MTVSIQFNNGKIEDQYNGLVDMQQELLAFGDTDRVTAIVTYEVTKDVRDRKKGETYPVVRPTHIEPITSPEALVAAKELQVSAYQVRTGETALDLPDVDAEDVDA